MPESSAPVERVFSYDNALTSCMFGRRDAPDMTQCSLRQAKTYLWNKRNPHIQTDIQQLLSVIRTAVLTACNELIIAYCI